MSPRDRSWLRQPFEPTGSTLLPSHADPVLDALQRTVTVDGASVRFSDVEFAVVALLLRHPGVLITREELSQHGWGEPLEHPDRVTSAIKRIRSRLRTAGIAEDPITTVHALGYRWERPEASDAWTELGRTG
jgi:DNA-binding response OmpR family regulator